MCICLSLWANSKYVEKISSMSCGPKQFTGCQIATEKLDQGSPGLGGVISHPLSGNGAAIDWVLR